MKLFETWKQRASALRIEAHALLLAYRDARTPWFARLFAAAVAAYAFSPIDLIPDFIPVLGYLDDLLLVPLGISLALRMIPPEVLADCRQKARARLPTAPLSRATHNVSIINDAQNRADAPPEERE